MVLPANWLFWKLATVVPAATLMPVPLLYMPEFDSRIVAVPLNPDTPVTLLLITVLSTFIVAVFSATMPILVFCDATELLIVTWPEKASSPNWQACSLTLSSEAVAVPVLVCILIPATPQLFI